MLRPDVLRDQRDFDRLYKKGRSAGEKYVVFFCRKNGLPYNRTAFLASKKVGNAVARNRARRLMRESHRLMEAEKSLPVGYDLLFIARGSILDSKCADVKKSMEAALKKTGIKRSEDQQVIV